MHPGYVRMKQSPDKTDIQDGHLLADLERVGYLPNVCLAPPELRDLRQLVRYRQQRMNQGRNVKLRIRALLREARLRPAEGVRPWTKAWLRWVQQVELGAQARWVMDQQLRHLKNPPRTRRPGQRARLIEVTGAGHGGATSAEAAGSRSGDGGDVASRDRSLRSLSHGQADGAVLWVESAERFERHAASGRRSGEGGEPGAASCAD
jgi:hypothetical protein